jgi:CHAP domain
MTTKRSTIGQKLASFVVQYQGKVGTGDTTVNRGQCVGLVAVWCDALGLPHVWGNAKDLLADADPTSYKRTDNTPTNFPIPGDIIVWGDIWGGGFGHTAIVVTATVMDFTAFEQNDPDGSVPHLKVYTYAGVKGWLRPLVKS